MKVCTNILTVALAGWICWGVAAQAQTNLSEPKPAGAAEAAPDTGNSLGTVTPTDTTISRVGQVLVPVKPAELDSLIGINVERPLRPERIELTPELAERLKRFEEYRRAYLEKQEALRKQFLSATDEDRANIREKLQRLRELWMERTRALRQEFQERQRDLLGKLKEHPEVIRSTRDDAREAIREQMLDQRRETREQLKEEGRPR